MCGSSRILRVRDRVAGVLGRVAAQRLVRELQTRVDARVALGEMRGEDLDVGLLAVVLVREEAEAQRWGSSVGTRREVEADMHTHDTPREHWTRSPWS